MTVCIEFKGYMALLEEIKDNLMLCENFPLPNTNFSLQGTSQASMHAVLYLPRASLCPILAAYVAYFIVVSEHPNFSVFILTHC